MSLKHHLEHNTSHSVHCMHHQGIKPITLPRPELVPIPPSSLQLTAPQLPSVTSGRMKN